MKKFIALVAIAVAPTLFAQEKKEIKKVSEASQVEAAKVEKKSETAAEANKATATATHAKGATSLQSSKATESKRSSANTEKRTR